jgi:hypothetical protein
MFGKQGKAAKAPVHPGHAGKKSAGKGVGLGQNAKPAALKTIKGNNNKLK